MNNTDIPTRRSRWLKLAKSLTLLTIKRNSLIRQACPDGFLDADDHRKNKDAIDKRPAPGNREKRSSLRASSLDKLRSMKPTVYIESSVVSYFVARPSRDLVVAAHQQLTSEWWGVALPQIDAFVSGLVLEEVGKGDSEVASRRLACIESFPQLDVTQEVDELAQLYFARLRLPDKALADAYHMALATWHGMDYLVSWNCAHIASGRVQRALVEVNGEMEYRTPVLCTPEELMDV